MTSPVPTTPPVLSPEQRATIAALMHEIMAIAGEADDDHNATVYGRLEEWHDAYRWSGGEDVFNTVTVAVSVDVSRVQAA